MTLLEFLIINNNKKKIDTRNCIDNFVFVLFIVYSVFFFYTVFAGNIVINNMG